MFKNFFKVISFDWNIIFYPFCTIYSTSDSFVITNLYYESVGYGALAWIDSPATARK